MRVFFMEAIQHRRVSPSLPLVLPDRSDVAGVVPVHTGSCCITQVLAHHGAVENNVVKIDLPVIQVRIIQQQYLAVR